VVVLSTVFDILASQTVWVYLHRFKQNVLEDATYSENGELKLGALQPYKVIQGHRSAYQSTALCAFLLVVNSNPGKFCTVSEILQRKLHKSPFLLTPVLLTDFARTDSLGNAL